MATCNGCGGCCDPVMLAYTQQEVRMLLDGEIDPENKRFVLEDLTPITRREGLRRSPYITGGGVTVIGNERTGESEMVYSHFFECRHYDPATKRCGNYDNRPPICKGFPWYDAGVDNLKSLPLECSFREEQTGVGVTIMDKLNARGRRYG